MGVASVPAQLRQQVDRWADTWLKAKFARLLELRAQDPGPFNYPIAVFSEWRGKAFYLNGKVYWTMDDSPEPTTLVNRCNEGQTWEARLAAGTLPGRSIRK
jgi:hypothetical protein